MGNNISRNRNNSTAIENTLLQSEDDSFNFVEDEESDFLFVQKVSSQTDWAHKDLTVTNARKLLKECQFPVHSRWEDIARNMEISLDKRQRLRIQVATEARDCETALEESVDEFLRNSSSPVTWDKFLSKVECVDRATAAKMRKKLGLVLMPDNIKELKRRCDHNILLCISGRIHPLSYISYFALESDCDEIRDHCASNNISHLSVNLDMLFKWRERKGPEATYLALLEIFQKTNDEKVIDLITEYVVKGRNCFFSGSEDLKFPKLNTERIDASELEKNHYEIREKFAYLRYRITISLEKIMEPKHLADYISEFCCFQFKSTNDITDIIKEASSWFNTKVLQTV